MFRCLLCSILEKEGFVCQEANNGEEAYLQLQQNPVDMIIADYDMPLMNGIDLLQHLPKVYLENSRHFSNRLL